MDMFFVIAIAALLVFSLVVVVINKRKENKEYLKVPKEEYPGSVPILLGTPEVYGIHPSTIVTGLNVEILSGGVSFTLKMLPSPVTDLVIPIHHFNFNPDLHKDVVRYNVEGVDINLNVVFSAGLTTTYLKAVPENPADLDKLLTHIKKCLHV